MPSAFTLWSFTCEITLISDPTRDPLDPQSISAPWLMGCVDLLDTLWVVLLTWQEVLGWDLLVVGLSSCGVSSKDMDMVRMGSGGL